MILIHDEINEIIDFRKSNYNILTVENKAFFRRLVKDLANQVKGFEGGFRLSIDLKQVKISEEVFLIYDLFNINLDTNRVKRYIEKNVKEVVSEKFINERSFKLLAEIRQMIDEISMELDYEIEYEEIDLYDIIKMSKFRYYQEEEDLRNLFEVMKFLSRSLSIKLIVILNYMNFVTEEEFLETINYLKLEKINVLFLETKPTGAYTNDNKLIIDEDLCEI